MFIQVEKAGTLDVSVYLRALDSTTGAPLTSLVYNSAGMDLQYRRDGAASTAITEATLSALTDAHADGGFLHVGNGVYRFDVPDAAFATGAKKVVIHGTATGAVFVPALVHLVSYDPFDAVRMGMTALPNAAAEAAGGLFTRGTGPGQINQDGNGRVDVNLKAYAGSTTAVDNLKDAALGIVRFTVGTGSTTKLIETNLASTVDDNFNDRVAVIVTGAMAGQAFRIFSYNGTTKRLVPYEALTGSLANGDTAVIV